MFDDSCDEQLFLCSQALEEKFADPKKVGAVEQYKILQTNNCNMQRLNVGTSNYKSSDHEKVIQNDRKNETKPEIQGISNFDNDNVQFRSIDDSFDSVLKEFEDEDLDILTQSNNNNTVPEKYQSNSLNSSFKRTVSDANVQYVPRKIEIEKPRFIFHRTHSFESAVTSKQDDLPQCLKDEIERKRKEALGRLKEKKEKEKKIQQTQAINDSYSNISPMKCSPDEIEQKRLQAKAIRDAKQRGIMEKNRLEALKRLEINRLKRQGKIK
ncbi:hypothetical protein HHI36_002267 [Cryptolaemus montrouzieri]|uniref:Uncharacterized protein n=1 Tax=Cryptolaemus montrouzieri TaxID=559131 RepID=A0ABD2PA93_9CUCU